jgi:hypothetical protein
VKWKHFVRAVNSKIFAVKKEAINLPSILAAAVLIATSVVLVLDAFDRWTTPLIQYLAPTSHHYLGKALCIFLVFLLLYLMLFAYHALDIAVGQGSESTNEIHRLLGEKDALKVESERQIDGLVREKEALKARSNYRDQLAAAVGMRLRVIHRECIVSNASGDCMVHEHEQFEVLGLSLGDLVRRQKSKCEFAVDDSVVVVVSSLPEETSYRHETSRRGEEHDVHVFFDPALERTDPAKPVHLLISRKVTKGFYMFREDIPSDWIETGRSESMAHLVLVPTDRLEISIQFPEGYKIPAKDCFIRVNYGIGESRHTEEETRLQRPSENQNDKSLHVTVLQNGGSKLSMTVNQPLLGLCYFLCWAPISRTEKGGPTATQSSKGKAKPD